MIRTTILASLCLTLAACVARPPTDTAQARLVGGEQEDRPDDPAVWLQNAGCTGVAVMPNVILTAAHCVTNADGSLKPDFAGTGGYLSLTNAVVLDGTEHYLDQHIGATYVHPTWLQACRDHGCGRDQPTAKTAPYPYDVAAIILSDPLPATTPLAQLNITTLGVGDTISFTGYGCENGLTPPHAGPQRRKIGTSTVLDASDVNAKNATEVADPVAFGQHYVVANGLRHDASTASLCPGDSGGPMFKGYPGSWALAGINAHYTFNPGEDVAYDNLFTRVVDPDLVSWLQLLMFGNPAAAPSAPTNVHAYYLTQFGASISWDPALAGTQSVTVARRPNAAVTLSPSTTSYVDPGDWGVDGQTYIYDVCFVNSIGTTCSTTSMVASSAPPIAPQPPLIPEHVKVDISAPPVTVAHVTWDGDAYAQYAAGDGFVVQARAWAPDVEPAWRQTALLPKTASSGDIALRPDLTYDVRACAVIDGSIDFCSPAPHFDAPPAPKGLRNLVINPSFEAPEGNAWFTNPRAPANQESGITTAHLGYADESLISKAGPTQVNQRVHVTPGQRYVLSVWLKGDIDAYFGVADSRGTQLAEAHVMPSSSSWTRYSLPFTMNGGGMAIVFAGGSLLASVAAPQLAVDDVALVPADDCLPLTCADAHACGALPDGCGGTVQCGSCAAGSCGGAGFANTCGVCPKRVCSADDCGPTPDGCGGTLHCKKCDAPPPPVCKAGAANCHPI